MMVKSIGIVGCGWLGSKLAKRLQGKYQLYATTRSIESSNQMASLEVSATPVHFSEEHKTIAEAWETIAVLDAIVVLVPFSLRRLNTNSLEIKMKNLCTFLGEFDGQLLFASSTGVYPQSPQAFTEDDLAIQENEVEYQFKQFFPHANILRFGGLMGNDRLLSKYPVSNREAPVNHIHYEDACSVLIQLIEKRSRDKLYNVVAPSHPSKEAVIQAQLNSTFKGEPDPAGRIISSQKLVTDLNFDFSYPDPRTFHL